MNQSITILDNDTIKYLSQWLSDNSKLSIMKTCKRFSLLGLFFNHEYHIAEIIDSVFYHNHVNIVMGESILLMHILKWPKNIKRLKIDNFKGPIKLETIPSTIRELVFGKDLRNSKCEFIPSFITHLGCESTNMKITNISSSVTHLRLKGFEKDLMTTSVTHLEFDMYDEQDDMVYIPTSVTHLILNSDIDEYFDSFIILRKNLIPPTVTHLTLRCNDYYYGNFAKDIPSTITYLTLGKYFDDPIIGKIASTIKNIVIENPDYAHPLPSNAVIV